MRRTTDQRQRDRADLLIVLTEATEPIRADHLIAAANGLQHVQVGSRAWQYGWTDLRALHRTGKAIFEWSSSGSARLEWTRWSLATGTAAAERDDVADLRKQVSAWEPAE